VRDARECLLAYINDLADWPDYYGRVEIRKYMQFVVNHQLTGAAMCANLLAKHPPNGKRCRKADRKHYGDALIAARRKIFAKLQRVPERTEL
jgi:hypothetical protein